MMTAAGMKPARNSATAEVLVTCGDHDHEDRRRHQHAHRGAGGDQRGGVLGAVAGPAQRRHQRRAERRDLGHLRAADVGEEIRHHDHRHAEPAAQPADQRARQLDQRVASCRSAPSGCRRTRRTGWRAAPSSASAATRLEASCCIGKPPSNRPATPAAPSAEHDRQRQQQQADEDDGRCGKDHALFPYVHDVVVGTGRIAGGAQRIERDQDAADHGGCVEPGQIEFERRRRQHRVEHASLTPYPGDQAAERRDQQVVARRGSRAARAARSDA